MKLPSFTSWVSLLVLASGVQADCNGNAAYCDRKFSNITFIGSHDSAFVGPFLPDNQDVSVTAQLNSGIRFLQAQTHKDIFGTLSLCHTSCFELDAGPLKSYLSTIKSWLDANPNEVVTLLLTNGDNLPVDSFCSAMNSSSLSDYAYSPGAHVGIDQWKTLQQLIDDKTRLVMFLDKLADTSVCSFILDEFSYYFETPFDVTTNFESCNLDRPSGSDGSGLMYIVNHFFDKDIFGIKIPDKDILTTTNAATGQGSIGDQAEICSQKWSRKPNVILVDFYDIGDVFTAQRNLNNV